MNTSRYTVVKASIHILICKGGQKRLKWLHLSQLIKTRWNSRGKFIFIESSMGKCCINKYLNWFTWDFGKYKNWMFLKKNHECNNHYAPALYNQVHPVVCCYLTIMLCTKSVYRNFIVPVLISGNDRTHSLFQLIATCSIKRVAKYNFWRGHGYTTMVSISFFSLYIESLSFAFKAAYLIFVLMIEIGQHSLFYLYVWSGVTVAWDLNVLVFFYW